MPYKNGSKLCICEICNCGRHKCPHHPHRGPLGECQISEYNNQYHAHKIEPVSAYKPATQSVRADGPLSDKTTHRMDYIPHPLEKPHHHQPDQYRRPEGDFEGNTSYNLEFTEKRGERAQLTKREGQRLAPGRFDGEPTYKTDYRKWDMPKIERGGAGYQYMPPKDAFEGLPTYMSDYTAPRMSMTQSFKPDNAAMHSTTPFDGITDYRQSYVPYPMEARKAKEKAMWNRPTVAFDGITTFQTDYTPKEGMRVGNCKPPAQANLSDAPLQSETTNRVDYKPWEMSRPFHHQPDIYRRPEGDMDMGTTYVRDYPQHALGKTLAVKPKDRPRNTAAFEGTTEHQDNFKRWQGARRLPAGPNNAYMPNANPFEGQSTHQAHFIQHPLDMVRSYKPDGRAMLSDAPFDDNTMYRTEFVPKELQRCPAASLDRGGSAYIFREQDDTGHKFYEPLQSSVTDLRTGRTVTQDNHRTMIAAAS